MSRARTTRANGPQQAVTPPPSPAAVPTLAELQALFQAAILTGDDDILALIPANSRTDAGVLFGVYRNAYVARLIEVIGNDHALTARYLGREAFEDLARGYVAAHPSTTQNARWVSRHLTAYARSAPRFADHGYVGDLIAIEAALNTAFDAADAPVLGLTDLQAVAPEQWDMLVFAPHPSAQRLSIGSNAFDLWLALKDDGEVPAAQTGATELLVWRHETAPMIRVIGTEEAMMWDEAAKGVRFGVLCEMLATFDDPDTSALRAAQYLQGWLLSGALSRANVSARPRKAPRALADKALSSR